jgi:S-methylmethionine-dependent homocysteine/selenocysteine methylase
MLNWRFEEIISPTEFYELASHWVGAGASAIGGCCGLSPKHIRNLATLKDPHHQSNS